MSKARYLSEVVQQGQEKFSKARSLHRRLEQAAVHQGVDNQFTAAGTLICYLRKGGIF